VWAGFIWHSRRRDSSRIDTLTNGVFL
jgi:hypothetical protein